MPTQLFRRFIVALVTVSMLAGQFFWPGEQAAMAAALIGGHSSPHAGSCDPNSPAVVQGADPMCRLAISASGARLAYPVIAWTGVAEFEGSKETGYDATYIGGGGRTKLELSGLRSAQMLGMTSDQAADMVNTFPVGVPVVFARYNPGTADLRIDLFKTEKVGTGFRLMNAVFSPHHGGLWAANGNYATPADRAAGNFGPNPFARFASGTDDVFHGINRNGVNVAVGHAMRLVQAAVGMVATADYRTHQYKTTKKSLLKKKITQYIDGYAKPTWTIATPPQFQPKGTSGAICAEEVGSNPCPAYAVAPAMVNFESWSGGNLSEIEDHVYHWQKTTSGWTVLAFILLTFVFMFALAAVAVMAGAAASSVSLAAQAVEGLMAMATGTTVSLGAVGVAAVNAGLYGLTAALAGGSLGDVQDGYAGKILSDGQLSPGAPANEHQAGILNETNRRMTGSALDGSLSAVRKTSYGDCSLTTATVAACGPAAKGFLPRADKALGQDYVQFFRDNGAPVKYDLGIGALN